MFVVLSSWFLVPGSGGSSARPCCPEHGLETNRKQMKIHYLRIKKPPTFTPEAMEIREPGNRSAIADAALEPRGGEHLLN
jgi:hypothetical protein